MKLGDKVKPDVLGRVGNNPQDQGDAAVVEQFHERAKTFGAVRVHRFETGQVAQQHEARAQLIHAIADGIEAVRHLRAIDMVAVADGEDTSGFIDTVRKHTA